MAGAVAAALVLALVAPPAHARRLDDPQPVGDGLAVAARAVYVVDPDAHVVHVTTDITLTNTAPGTATTYTYFDAFSAPVLAEVEGVAASVGGRDLPVTLEPSPSPYVAMARIDLRPDLLYRQTQVVHLTYDIPPLPARSTGLSRINDAFVTFPVLPYADPGQADVEVDVPHRFDVETVGGVLTESSDGVIDRYTATAIADPLRFDVFVAASDESKLAKATVDVSGTSFTVHGWPDDAAWADYVAAEIHKVVPGLVDRVGMPLPVPALDVFETVTPYLYGFGGWYLRNGHRIDIGDELDPVVVAHEISHAWFNEQLIDSRWVDEGLAQEYAAQVVAASGDAAADPIAPDPSAPGAVRLSSWADPDLTAQHSVEQEQYGYDASYAVVHAIAAELGPDRMRLVLRAADDRTIAYRGSGDAERDGGVADWHHFLDLVDEVGGATQADPLVRELVATDDERALLDQRGAARAAYHALVAELGGWSAPLAVRDAMERWRFSDVAGLIAGARAAKALVDEATTLVAPLHLEPFALRREFESAASLDGLAADAADTVAAAKVIVTADAAVHGDHGPLERVGLLGSPADAHVARARTAFEGGRPLDATREAQAALRAVDGAAGDGARRLALAAGGALVVVVVARVVRARRARPALDELGGLDGPSPYAGLPSTPERRDERPAPTDDR